MSRYTYTWLVDSYQLASKGIINKQTKGTLKYYNKYILSKKKRKSLLRKAESIAASTQKAKIRTARKIANLI